MKIQSFNDKKPKQILKKKSYGFQNLFLNLGNLKLKNYGSVKITLLSYIFTFTFKQKAG